MRQTGDETLTSEPFEHPALFYRDRDDYLAGTVPFVEDGLAAGEPVAVSVPGPNLRILRVALGADADRVTMFDMTRVGRNPGRILPAVLWKFADEHPDRPVRIIGEPVWAGRSDVEYPACAQHEALINRAFAGHAVTILCPYDTGRLGPEVLADARANHPVLIDTEGARPSATYAPDAVAERHNRPLTRPSPHAVRAFYDAGLLPDVRHFAVEHARRLGLRGTRLDDLSLVTAELTTNSVVHGGGSGALRLWAENGRLVCEVRDRGRFTDPLAGRRQPPPGRPGGRGLLLVNHLADLVRHHTGAHGTTVRAYFEL